MKNLLYTIFLCLFINGLYAKNTIFDFKKANTKITKNQENTQFLDFRKDIFINKLDDIEVYIPFGLPLIDKRFLDVTIKQFSVVNENHTLIIETDAGTVLTSTYGGTGLSSHGSTGQIMVSTGSGFQMQNIDGGTYS